MANTTLQLKKSGVTGNVPSSLEFGELALNYADGKLYYKAANSSITYIQSGSTTDSFATINANSSLILATSPTDTLSIAAGNNITISACTTTKTITINSQDADVDQFARNRANSAIDLAQSAYDYANTISGGSAVDNVARTLAQNAYDFANTANTPAGSTTQVQFNDGGIRGASSSLTFDKSTGYFKAPIIESTNNGNGTNFKVGDDAWIGDVNIADTIRITGQQNANNAYIVFGSSNANTLGRAGSGPLTYTGAFTATGAVSGNELASTNSSGNEGGQVNLAIPASGTSLVGGVIIDVYQNQLRFFQGDSAKGAYIDLTAAASGVGSNLLSGGATVDSVARGLAQNAYNQANTASANTIVTQGVDLTQNTQIFGIQGVDLAQNSAISIIQGVDATQNTRLNSLETINTDQNTAISIIQGTDVTQNVRLNSIETINNDQNTTITQVNQFAQSAYDHANTKFASAGGTITGPVVISANNNLTVTGNLNVLGTTTTVNTNLLEVNDPMILLANGNFYSDTLDIGFAAHYNDGANAHTGLFREHANKDWYLFQGYTPEVSGNNDININDSSFRTANLNADYVKANVIATTAVIGGINFTNYVSLVSGIDATQNTRLNSIETINNDQNTTITQVNQYAASAYQTANQTNQYAQSAYAHANNAYNYANTSISYNDGVNATQNTRIGGIEGVDLAQNAAITIIQGVDATQNTTITAVNQFAGAGFNTANQAFNQANTATGLAQAAFNYANTLTVSSTDQFARDTANSASANTIITQGVDSWQNTQITAVNQFAQSAYNQANTGGGGGTTVTISNDNTSNNVYYINFTANTSGTANTLFTSNNNLTFNPSTGTIGVKAINLTANTNISANTIDLTDTSQVTIDSFSTSVYRSAFYQVQLSSPSEFHMLNLNIIHNGITVFANTFGDAYSSSSLGSFTGSIVGTTLNVLFTPTNSSVTVAFIRNAIARIGVEAPSGSLGFVGDPVTATFNAGFDLDATTSSFDYGTVG